MTRCFVPSVLALTALGGCAAAEQPIAIGTATESPAQATASESAPRATASPPVWTSASWWRAISEGTGPEWVTPRAFRKTVVTIIEREADAKGAAARLGHTSEAITQGYYVVKTHRAPDFSDILEHLGPEDGADQAVSLE